MPPATGPVPAKSDSARLDFLQRYPRCVAPCATRPGEGPCWIAEPPIVTRNATKIFSSLRDAVDYAMAPASGIEPRDLVPGDYCEAKVRLIREYDSYHIRLCRVEETHGRIIKVATATRKGLVPILRSDVVGLGWRKA